MDSAIKVCKLYIHGKPEAASAASGRKSKKTADITGEIDQLHRTNRPMVDGNRRRHLCGLYALVQPAARHQRVLREAIDLLGYPPLTTDKLERAERKLKTLLDDSRLHRHARLWLAICERIRGHDSSTDFEEILKAEPDNRLALVNLAATYLTCTYKRYPHVDAETRAVLERLQKYAVKHPSDVFARLVAALLIQQSCYDDAKAIDALEQIYLDAKEYTPATSAMAAILNNTGRHDAGYDYAREAEKQEPHNFQAAEIVRRSVRHPLLHTRASYNPLGHVSAAPTLAGYQSMLFGPYFIQDPLVRSTESNGLVRASMDYDC